ncbi:hypothetical protein H6794_03020 [Candidatus Nomurabacteria bacterium]|nr:hypothetical protein [Candidatus Saccharibacteria bacterium]MCB9839802.1 hypothetical protein [Candidatus Nomurabacteria bacterium]
MNETVRDYEKPEHRLNSSQQDIWEVTSSIRAMAKYGIYGLGSSDPAADRHEGQLLNDYLQQQRG